VSQLNLICLPMLFCMALFASCQSAPLAPEPKPSPKPALVVAPKPPTEPFIALFQPWGEGRVTRQQFKDHFLAAFTEADALDGKIDGIVSIAESCKQLVGLCRAADSNGDGKLTLKEFLDKLDELFDNADRDQKDALTPRELRSLRPE
jgi:hypothetical protein